MTSLECWFPQKKKKKNKLNQLAQTIESGTLKMLVLSWGSVSKDNDITLEKGKAQILYKKINVFEQ